MDTKPSLYGVANLLLRGVLNTHLAEGHVLNAWQARHLNEAFRQARQLFQDPENSPLPNDIVKALDALLGQHAWSHAGRWYVDKPGEDERTISAEDMHELIVRELARVVRPGEVRLTAEGRAAAEAYAQAGAFKLPEGR